MFYKTLTVKQVDWNLPIKIQVNFSKTLYERHFHNVEDIVPSDLLDKFDSIGLRPSIVRIFAWPRNHVGIWHVDGRYFADNKQVSSAQHVSMNWVVAGSGKIQWRQNILPNLKPLVGVYLGTQSSLDDEFDEETDSDAVFVDTEVPHRVLTGLDGRTTVTLKWNTIGSDLKFPAMVEKFKSIGLIV